MHYAQIIMLVIGVPLVGTLLVITIRDYLRVLRDHLNKRF